MLNEVTMHFNAINSVKFISAADKNISCHFLKMFMQSLVCSESDDTSYRGGNCSDLRYCSGCLLPLQVRDR